MNPLLQKYLAGLPLSGLSEAKLKSLLDSCRSALLAVPQYHKQILDAQRDICETGPTHTAYNSAVFASAKQIESASRAYNAVHTSIAPLATPRAALVEKKVRKPEPNPYAPRKGEPNLLPPLPKKAPAKASGPQPPATPTLDAMNKLKGIPRQQFISANTKAIAREQGILRRWENDKAQKYNKFSR